MIRIIFPLLVGIAALFSGASIAQSGIRLADDAPDTYTVVKGDTLWDISGRFLREPWRWPEVWRLNRDQIRNPHLIYPGQVVMLDRSGPWLTIGRRIGGSDKLQPQVHTEALESAVPSIPVHIIEPFLNKPLVVDQANLEGAATIVATETSRVMTGAGDTVFAKNVDAGTEVWQIMRPARPLKDPLKGEIIGYEADYLGTARVIERGELATLEILSAVEEIGTGDLMLPSEPPSVFAYVPHAPEHEVEGRVVSIYRGVSETGRLHVVALNAGGREGLEAGHVLSLFRNRGTAVYRGSEGKETFNLPEKRYGLVFVFRVFERVSYALVMETDGPVTVGDAVRKP
ncbi:LysM peptidoglycan-binding domain-containing protein [Thauera linaloolentis]|uniref:Peptidoglycan-binding LysM n=1 Tax=Thauera linaloolentis (strain DSM 12138 / JCM 21573 / CCUG 41526 / CIP 105981 / IAM 15112 / NBRC 102519 / 47Lol) TaxID=1123367 RepID=N6Y4R1_THAL4|nr:LysM domain-containing protein [Thauera linaloolentis]ENO89176.1 peptidoglycan-binding LysM [Thauera linaloolentis 47Lol = DSM 12138]MCM8567292.1 LysM peptidoglycan-binding domain-containing protein [Thauera linaloolentis]